MTDMVDVLLRLRGGPEFKAGIDRARASVRKFAKDQDVLGRSQRLVAAGSQKVSSGFGWIAQKANLAGYAIGAVAVATATLGLKFNATMEQNQVAFKYFLGSTEKANAYLDKLFNLAAKSPFEFSGLSSAAKQLIAFGFSADGAYNSLSNISNAVSALGTGQEGINRIVLALGQMKAAGVVQGDELRQFQEAGINVYKYLEKAGLITKADIGQIGDMHLDATKAIDAIMKGMHRDFNGMTRVQSKTWTGQLSTMKDYAGQAAGALTKPIFDLLKSNVFPKINEKLKGIVGWARGGGLERVGQGLTAGFKGDGLKESSDPMQNAAIKAGGIARQVVDVAKKAWTGFMEMIAPAKPFLDNVLIPLVTGIAKGILGSLVAAFKVVVPVLRIFFQVLGFIGRVMAPFKGVIEGIGMVVGFVFGGPILKAVGMLGKLGGVFRIVGLAAKLLSWPLRIQGKAFLSVFRGALKLGGYLGRGLMGAFRAVGRIAGRVGGTMMNLGKSIVSKIVDGIKAAPGIIKDAVMGLIPGPLKSAAKKALGWAGFAKGGYMGASGMRWIGENGPELLHLPRGSSVEPVRRNDRKKPMRTSASGDGVNVVTKVFLDRRQIAEAVSDEVAFAGNRR